jgi:hypothetical protein
MYKNYIIKRNRNSFEIYSFFRKWKAINKLLKISHNLSLKQSVLIKDLITKRSVLTQQN